MIDFVDYNLIWRMMRKRAPSRSFDWDKLAASFNETFSGTSDETEEVVQSLNLLPTDTVLDMGAGTGRYTVPLSKNAAHVTALEPSKGMLAYLEENMNNAGQTNYSVVNKTLEEVTVGTDIQMHDVVFASNSLGFDDLRAGLEKLNALARRTVHILWFAGPTRHIPEPGVMKILGAEMADMSPPDYLTIVHVLHSMGIYPNVSVEKRTNEQRYDSLDEAADFWTKKGNYSEEIQDRVREYMREALIPDDDGRFHTETANYPVRIWWNTEDYSDHSG